jgi:integrase
MLSKTLPYYPFSSGASILGFDYLSFIIHKRNMNEQLIKDFSEYLLSEKISDVRIKKYQSTLRTITKKMNKPFEKCDKDDIMNFLARLEKDSYLVNNKKEKKNYSVNTKKDFRVVIKRFWKWLKKTEDYPVEVKWIKSAIPKRLQKIIRTKDVLTEEEVYKMVDNAQHTRDKAIISLLYETGSRIGEIEKLKIGDIVFDEKGYNFVSNGKTGDVYKRVVNIKAVELLKEWISQHPMKSDPKAYLWITLARSHTGMKQMRQAGFSKMLKEVANISSITKAVNPHAFRHARITDLRVNRKVSDAVIEMLVGWTPGTNMFDIYQHAKSEDVDKALIETYGLKDEQKKNKMIDSLDKALAEDKDFRLKVAKLLQARGMKE